MILVDVYIPSIDDTYDFMLDENIVLEQIIAEISEIISKKVKAPLPLDIGNLMMCSLDRNEILSRNETLHENGIQDGSRLLLV